MPITVVGQLCLQQCVFALCTKLRHSVASNLCSFLLITLFPFTRWPSLWRKESATHVILLNDVTRFHVAFNLIFSQDCQCMVQSCDSCFFEFRYTHWHILQSLIERVKVFCLALNVWASSDMHRLHSRCIFARNLLCCGGQSADLRSETSVLQHCIWLIFIFLFIRVLWPRFPITTLSKNSITHVSLVTDYMLWLVIVQNTDGVVYNVILVHKWL